MKLEGKLSNKKRSPRMPLRSSADRKTVQDVLQLADMHVSER